ncbi:MAG: ribonuclease P protein component [Anaerolineales bacterium]
MKRRFRLTKSTDFKRVRQQGEPYSHPLMVLIALQNGLDQPRIAVSAGRTVGNAVKRNRAKRLIRSALQPLLDSISPGWDIVLIARHQIVDATLQDTFSALQSLLRRAKLISRPNDN